jgi:hypothetical protein
MAKLTLSVDTHVVSRIASSLPYAGSRDALLDME